MRKLVSSIDNFILFLLKSTVMSITIMVTVPCVSSGNFLHVKHLVGIGL